MARWNPRPFMPTARDRAAGDELVALIRELPGEVWYSHPWYAHLAGKTMYVHRMGVKDVTTLWTTAGTTYNRLSRGYRFDNIQLAAALRRRRRDAIVLDDPIVTGRWAHSGWPTASTISSPSRAAAAGQRRRPVVPGFNLDPGRARGAAAGVGAC